MKTDYRKIVSIFLLILLMASAFTSMAMTTTADSPTESPNKTSDNINKGFSASITVIGDYGEDLDYDGLFDVLHVEVQIEVNETSEYRLELTDLLDAESNHISVGCSHDLFLYNHSSNYDNLILSGPYIHRSSLKPSHIYKIVLYDSKGNAVAEVSYVPLSRTYNYAEFDPPGAEFLYGEYEVVAINTDSDPNNLYDILWVKMLVWVYKPGGYIIQIPGPPPGTEPPPGELMGTYEQYVHFATQGEHPVTFTIHGAVIYRYGVNISRISKVLLYDYNYVLLDEHDELSFGSYNYTEFEVPSAEFTCNISDWGVDEDLDGQFDRLVVGVEVNVSCAGEYAVDISGLVDSEGGIIDISGGRCVYLDEGVSTVNVSLPGRAIRGTERNVTGVYQIQLHDENDWFLDEKRWANLTRQYNYTEFEEVALFTCNTTDWGVDMDGDGYYDQLILGAEVSIIDPGYYTFEAFGLVSSENEAIFISTDFQYGYLEPGIYWVNFTFNGELIFRQMRNITGVWCLRIWDNLYNFILHEKYNVSLRRQYNYMEFDPVTCFTCRTFDCGVDTDGNDLYDELVVGVELFVAEPGYYILEATGLMDDYGSYVDVSDWVEGYFEPGLYVVNLTFSGKPIYVSKLNVTEISEIYLLGSEYEAIDSKYDVPLSRRYNYMEFDPVTHFTCRVFDRGLDTDGSGLYDWLEVKVELNVTEPGTYPVYIWGLEDEEGHCIWLTNETDVSLDVGVHNVTLLLYGPAIAYSRLNPANITEIEIRAAETPEWSYWTSKWDVPLSRTYNYTEFDSPFTDLDVNFLVGPDGRVEAEGTMNATYIPGPPGITEYFDFSTLQFNDGLWWSNGSFTFYVPKGEHEMYVTGLPIPVITGVDPDKFPLNSTYLSYYEILSEGINRGEMNFTMILPPVYNETFPFNASDLTVWGSFNGVDLEGGVHATLTANLTTLFPTLLGLPPLLNETVGLPFHLSLDVSEGEYEGVLTFYLTEWWPLKLLDLYLSGNLSSLCINGSMDIIYGYYGSPLYMNVTQDWAEGLVSYYNSYLNETIYNATEGMVEAPTVNITLTNITEGSEVIGAHITLQVCVQEVEGYEGAILFNLLYPAFEMVDWYGPYVLWLLNAVNDTLSKIDGHIDLLYTPSTTTTDLSITGTIYLREILTQLLEPVTPPGWWPYWLEVPPEVNSTVLPCLWNLVGVLNATTSSFQDTSLLISYSRDTGRLDVNTSYTLDFEAMRRSLMELVPPPEECLPMPEPMPPIPMEFFKLMEEFLNGTYVNITWFEMSITYADGVLQEDVNALWEGDLNAAVNRIFSTILEVVNETAYTPPPADVMEFLNATELDLSDFNVHAAIEWNSIEGGMRLAAYVPTDPINETSFRLTRLFSLFCGMPIPNAWSKLSLRVEGGSNETYGVLVSWPGGEPMPDVVDPYGRYVAWENVTVCSASPLVFTLSPRVFVIETDRPVYTWRETVTATAFFSEAGVPVEDATVTIQVCFPNGTMWHEWAATTDEDGLANFTFLIVPELEAGTYTIYATAYKPGIGNATASTTFEVAFLTPILEVTFEREGYWDGNMTMADVNETLRMWVWNVGNTTAWDLDLSMLLPEGAEFIEGNLTATTDLTHLPPNNKIGVWVVFQVHDDGLYTFFLTGSYYDAAHGTTRSIEASIDVTVVFDLEHPVGILSYTYGTGSIEFNVTLKNYGDSPATVLLALTGLDSLENPLRPDTETVTLAAGETRVITLTLDGVSAGDYLCEVILLTGEPKYGGYALEYATQSVTV
ncbi:hypothetical protein J7L60_02090 [Candidatus Bathyarchaeota archaeon]|nr:hypothetical protein [Candidatus Bathyarchaeota archaeon]